MKSNYGVRENRVPSTARWSTNFIKTIHRLSAPSSVADYAFEIHLRHAMHVFQLGHFCLKLLSSSGIGVDHVLGRLLFKTESFFSKEFSKEEVVPGDNPGTFVSTYLYLAHLGPLKLLACL